MRYRFNFIKLITKTAIRQIYYIFLINFVSNDRISLCKIHPDFTMLYLSTTVSKGISGFKTLSPAP
jgi:hypothetical protein